MILYRAFMPKATFAAQSRFLTVHIVASLVEHASGRTGDDHVDEG